jgi:hypothetical protein
MFQASFKGSVQDPVTQPTNTNVHYLPTATDKCHIQHINLQSWFEFVEKKTIAVLVEMKTQKDAKY